MRSSVIALVAAVALFGVMSATAATDEAEDQAVADQIVLQGSDVPAGWQGEPFIAEEPTDLPECKRVEKADAGARKAPFAESPTFSDPATTAGPFLDSRASVFAKTKAAKKNLKAYKGEDALACFEFTLTLLGGGEGTVEEVDVAVGDDGVGYQAVVEDLGEAAYSQIVIVRVGRTVLTLTTFSIGAPFGPTDLVTAMVQRAEQAA